MNTSLLKTRVSLEAFCHALPTPERVTALLQPLGFSLTYQRGAIRGLPPQYHYRDNKGTEVMYLAGKDVLTADGPYRLTCPVGGSTLVIPLRPFPRSRIP